MLERGPYGVEWTNRANRDKPSSLGRVVLVVMLVSCVSFGWTLVKRHLRKRAEAELVPPPVECAESTASIAPPPPPPPPPTDVSRPDSRPPKVRNLLMRLEVAEREKNVELAASTIETLRELPGSPAADLDDALARRLGVLNIRRLFLHKNAQWVTEVVVKSGDSASRLAQEHGSTLSSLIKLNGGNVERLRIGQKLSVINHPRFNLIVRTRSRTADLQLNGKFFKRYDLSSCDSLENGSFEWREVSLNLKQADKSELDMLLPRSTSVLISEI